MSSSSNTNPPPQDLSASDLTLPSRSSAYHPSSSSESPHSDSSHESASAPVILYQPPTFWSLLRGAAINLFLPFVNGLMLGFGELFAHEAAFRLGWSQTKVFPYGSSGHPIGPGVEVREDLSRRRAEAQLEDLASLE